MKSIIDKFETKRTAVAESTIILKPETIRRVQANDLPKKDVLTIARAAAVMAAKRTPDLIPYCHPIPIDAVTAEFLVGKDRITAEVCVEAIGKTGVEMEALTAAAAATLTIYDMLKPIDQGMEIVSNKLLKKKGGKSDFKEVLPSGLKAAVVVTSDGTFAGKRKDTSGQLIKERLEAGGISPSYTVLPDDCEQIKTLFERLCREGTQLIISTGGTGLGPRDVTVEATREMMDREIPGIMEAARAFGQRRTPYAMLSRGLAAQKGQTIIINLPGSSNGTREALDALFPAVLHSFHMMNGRGH